jgi:hypothetical protein
MDEMYLVVRVDRDTEVADLLPVVYGKPALFSVPFMVMEEILGCGSPQIKPNGHYTA